MTDHSKQAVERFIAQFIDGAHGCHMTWDDAQIFARDLRAVMAQASADHDALRFDMQRMKENETDTVNRAEAVETALSAEVERLQAALATARDDALEDAAMVADRASEYREGQLLTRNHEDYMQRQRWIAAKMQADIIGENIRAMKAP